VGREGSDLPAYALRLRALKAALGLKNQGELAAALGTDQGTVSKWMNGKSRPLPEVFTRMAALAQGADKIFFLDQAGIPAEFFDGAPMLMELRGPSTVIVSRALQEESTASELCTSKEPRTIPLLKSPKKLGSKSLISDNVELCLSLPATWFPENSDLQAVRFAGSFSPFISGDLIALVDISRKDADRLIGCVVAVKTPTGVEPMTVHKDGPTCFLVPLHEDTEHPVRVLRHSGPWSIVGRVLKWMGDAPPARK